VNLDEIAGLGELARAWDKLNELKAARGGYTAGCGRSGRTTARSAHTGLLAGSAGG